MELYQGDCLELMKNIPDKSIDMILCDLPYGTTQCKWDKVIPFEPLWEQYKRIIKGNGAIVLFSQQPFTSKLVCSNMKMFRYEWIYQKTNPTGFLNSHKMPLKSHENILIFYKRLPTYNPQFTVGKAYSHVPPTYSTVYRKLVRESNNIYGNKRFPKDVIKFNNANGKNRKLHPTEKPVALLEYLIKTYTNENELVLDNCMGSGSTGVACVNTNRDFIGIELEKDYFDIAQERIENAIKTKPLD